MCRNTATRTTNVYSHRVDRSTSSKFKCKACSFKSSTRRGLNLHLRLIHKLQVSNKFECIFCGKTSKSTSNVLHPNTYLRPHIMESPYFCKLCPSEFREKRALARHVRSLHPQVGEKDISLECIFCNKSFSSPQHLQHHLLVHIKERPNVCKLCGHESTTSTNLKGHLKTHDPSRIKSFKCELCPKIYLNHSELQRHINNLHLNVVSFSCKVCKNTFKTAQTLRIHLQDGHHKDRPWICNTCGMAFKTKATLNGHQQIHSDAPRVRKYKCDLCQTTFSRDDGLKMHILRVHTKSVEGIPLKVQIFKCIICNVEFPFKSVLRAHKKTHVGEKLHCKICDVEFLKYPYYEAHLKAHANKWKKFKCEICGCRFGGRNYFNLHTVKTHNLQGFGYECVFCGVTLTGPADGSKVRDHLYSHIKETPYFCNICTSGFCRKKQLKRHLGTHESTLEYLGQREECIFCGKVLSSKRSLLFHLLSHIQEKWYYCGICDFECSIKQKFKKHLESHADKQQEKTFQCELCPSKFINSKQLQCHIQSHLDERPAQCEICGKFYRSAGEVTRHRKRVHTMEKLHKCDICPRTYFLNCELKRHKRVFHKIE